MSGESEHQEIVQNIKEDLNRFLQEEKEQRKAAVNPDFPQEVPADWADWDWDKPAITLETDQTEQQEPDSTYSKPRLKRRGQIFLILCAAVFLSGAQAVLGPAVAYLNATFGPWSAWGLFIIFLGLNALVLAVRDRHRAGALCLGVFAILVGMTVAYDFWTIEGGTMAFWDQLGTWGAARQEAFAALTPFKNWLEGIGNTAAILLTLGQALDQVVGLGLRLACSAVIWFAYIGRTLVAAASSLIVIKIIFSTADAGQNAIRKRKTRRVQAQAVRAQVAEDLAAETQEAETQEAKTQEAETQEAEAQEAEAQEVEDQAVEIQTSAAAAVLAAATIEAHPRAQAPTSVPEPIETVTPQKIIRFFSKPALGEVPLILREGTSGRQVAEQEHELLAPGSEETVKDVVVRDARGVVIKYIPRF